MNYQPSGSNLVERVFIAPRALASAGDPRWITMPLHHGHGWKNLAEPLLPEVRLTSPDARSELSLVPHTDRPWWHLYGAPEGRPGWMATFSSGTPVEIIGAITDAMTASPPATAGDPFEVLSAAGWQSAYGELSVLRSPEGFSEFQYDERGTDARWVAETMVSGDPEGQVWRAYLDQHTPLHLLCAFASALASPEPVPRPGMSTAVPSHDSRMFVTTTSAWVRPTYDAELLAARVKAAQATAQPASPAVLPAPALAPTRRSR